MEEDKPRWTPEPLDTEDKATYALELARGDSADVADILALVYDGRLSRKDVFKFVQEPSSRDYLGME